MHITRQGKMWVKNGIVAFAIMSIRKKNRDVYQW
jgi:hypothetical protein